MTTPLIEIGVAVEPAAGQHLYEAIKQAIEVAKHAPRAYVWMIFNDTAVRVAFDDTVDSAARRYYLRRPL